MIPTDFPSLFIRHMQALEPATIHPDPTRRLSKKIFSRCVDTKGRELSFTFACLDGVKPSDAIFTQSKKIRHLDSGTVYMLAFYRALCEFIGKEKFDLLYDGINLILKNSPDKASKCFFERVRIENATDIKPGDMCCFKNLMAYSFKHGLSENFFVANSGDKFLGQGISSQGLTKVEVEHLLLSEYNKPSAVYATGSFAHHTMTYESFIDVQTNPPFPKEGRLYLRVLRIQLDRIEQLASASFFEFEELLEDWGRPLKKQREGSPSI